MKSALIQFVALATLAVAQNLNGIPQCAISCLEDGIPKVGCAVTDMACYCDAKTQSKLVSVVLPCLTKACNVAELSKVQSAAASDCAAFFKTATNTAAAAASTAAASSTAAPTSAPATATGSGAKPTESTAGAKSESASASASKSASGSGSAGSAATATTAAGSSTGTGSATAKVTTGAAAGGPAIGAIAAILAMLAL